MLYSLHDIHSNLKMTTIIVQQQKQLKWSYNEEFTLLQVKQICYTVVKGKDFHQKPHYTPE